MQKTLLIVDDCAKARGVTRAMVESFGHRCIEAADGTAGLAVAAEARPDLVVLDIRMPDPDGFETARRFRASVSETTPIVVVTGLDDSATRVRAIDAGANDVLVKPIERDLLGVRIRTLLELHAKVEQLTTGQNAALALAKAVEAKSHYTNGHARRTALWASRIARELGLPPERIGVVHVGALLHDVGKIGIPDALLDKCETLTPAEWEVMRTHPAVGAAILKPLQIDPLVVQIARSHHERMDGGGYPDGRKLGELPLEVRLVQVADAFDALTSNRPYRRPSRIEEAVGILRADADRGGFDEQLVDLVAQLAADRVLGPASLH